MDQQQRPDLGLSPRSAPIPDGASTQEVLVTGMTCGHCVASVTEELSELAEVQQVAVDLRVGGASRVTIVTSSPVGDDRIRSAVEEAGYAVAGSTGA